MAEAPPPKNHPEPKGTPEAPPEDPNAALRERLQRARQLFDEACKNDAPPPRGFPDELRGRDISSPAPPTEGGLAYLRGQSQRASGSDASRSPGSPVTPAAGLDVPLTVPTRTTLPGAEPAAAAPRPLWGTGLGELLHQAGLAGSVTADEYASLPLDRQKAYLLVAQAAVGSSKSLGALVGFDTGVKKDMLAALDELGQQIIDRESGAHAPPPPPLSPAASRDPDVVLPTAPPAPPLAPDLRARRIATATGAPIEVSELVKAVTRRNLTVSPVATGETFQINGRDIKARAGLHSQGPDTDIPRLPDAHALENLTFAIRGIREEFPELIGSHFVGITPSDRAGHSIITVHYFQNIDVYESRGGGVNLGHIQAELPTAQMAMLRDAIIDDPNRLEEFYQGAFGSDASVGVPGVRRIPADRFYLFEDSNMLNINPMGQSKYPDAEIRRIFQNMEPHRYSRPYGTGFNVDTPIERVELSELLREARERLELTPDQLDALDKTGLTHALRAKIRAKLEQAGNVIGGQVQALEVQADRLQVLAGEIQRRPHLPSAAAPPEPGAGPDAAPAGPPSVPSGEVQAASSSEQILDKSLLWGIFEKCTNIYRVGGRRDIARFGQNVELTAAELTELDRLVAQARIVHEEFVQKEPGWSQFQALLATERARQGANVRVSSWEWVKEAELKVLEPGTPDEVTAINAPYGTYTLYQWQRKIDDQIRDSRLYREGRKTEIPSATTFGENVNSLYSLVAAKDKRYLHSVPFGMRQLNTLYLESELLAKIGITDLKAFRDLTDEVKLGLINVALAEDWAARTGSGVVEMQEAHDFNLSTATRDEILQLTVAAGPYPEVAAIELRRRIFDAHRPTGVVIPLDFPDRPYENWDEQELLGRLLDREQREIFSSQSRDEKALALSRGLLIKLPERLELGSTSDSQYIQYDHYEGVYTELMRRIVEGKL